MKLREKLRPGRGGQHLTGGLGLVGRGVDEIKADAAGTRQRGVLGVAGDSVLDFLLDERRGRQHFDHILNALAHQLLVNRIQIVSFKAPEFNFDLGSDMALRLEILLWIRLQDVLDLRCPIHDGCETTSTTTAISAHSPLSAAAT